MNCTFSDTVAPSTVGILVRNSAEGIMMIVGTFLANSTSVIVDVDKTPIDRINMIFQDAGVRSVLVLDKDEEIVQSLDDAFAVFAWCEILDLGKTGIFPVKAPISETHPFAIYYTR